MKRVLVKCVDAFIGDMLFASSIAERLVAESTEPIEVDFYLRLPQPSILLEMNQSIHRVYTAPVDERGYDSIVNIPIVNQNTPATVQFQLAAGVANTKTEFPVWTVDSFDPPAKDLVSRLRALGKPVVAWQADWKSKTALLELVGEKTTNVYDQSYHHASGASRDIDHIIRALDAHVTLVSVGLTEQFNQYTKESQDPYGYAMTASVIKYCDWMIGAEGGMTNLSSAVGTPTIITTDWMWKQFGPCGAMRQCPKPAMGPMTYFPNADHVHLSPFLTDDEVINAIVDIVSTENIDVHGEWFNAH